ncbi:MAG TPA: hypothetical protein VGS99_00325, partial [Gammaproteobacteria bacterium]|nr:hypothetical protein [Gammaproteobacteria bacterium]
KLNLTDQKAICVLDAPDSFRRELATLKGVKVAESLSAAGELVFALAFVTRKAEVDKVAKALAKKAQGDAIVWFAYPKGTSKKYRCDFNRDSGWDVLKKSGFDTVRQVAIDEDWSALRFRRTEFIGSR